MDKQTFYICIKSNTSNSKSNAKKGNVHGGEIITLTGIDLNGTPSVNIDG
jgi:hypothetical protein